jgi:hypothetical protein
MGGRSAINVLVNTTRSETHTNASIHAYEGNCPHIPYHSVVLDWQIPGGIPFRDTHGVALCCGHDAQIGLATTREQTKTEDRRCYVESGY